MYFTDRGIEELESRTFVDLNPEFETPVERLASWLARLDDD